MNKHHFRISWLFAGYGLVSLVAFLIVGPHIAEQFRSANAAFGIDGLTPIQAVLYYSILSISVIVFVAGVANYFSWKLAEPLLLVASVLIISSSPVGTVIGVYYFWYRFFYPGNSPQRRAHTKAGY